jgi:putative ABC transport system permease protein
MQTFDQGLRSENVYTNLFTLEPAKHYDTPEKILGFTHAALERIQALPDVKHAAVTLGVPMGGRNSVPQVAFVLEGQPMPRSPNDPIALTDCYAVSPDYFQVMSIPLIRGRGIKAQDTAGSPRVVVINREMVRTCFPNADPIGRRIRLFTRFANPETDWAEIVGVVGDVKPRGPTSPTNPQVYKAFDQSPAAMMTLVLRTNGSAPGLPATIRDIIHSTEKSVFFETIYGYDATIAYSWVQQRFNMILFTLFAAMALLLAAIGIYGVMSYSVSQRTHEIGIRMALGALPRDVLRLVLTQGARVVGLGLVLGTLVSLAATRLLSALLFNTSPYDPVTFGVILVVLSAVALFACWFPARRATKVNPMIALRSE